jgi:transposase
MKQISENSGKVVFKEYDQSQLIFLPPHLDELIPENHLVRIINQVIEGIELKQLEKVYSGGGASSYHPKMMLKVLLYAYSTKVYSCRQIATSLEKDIHFMWLSAMQRPRFRTINNFQRGVMKDLIEDVFSEVLSFLMEHGYVKLENYFVDGTKMRADANKYSHVWASNTERYKEGLKQRIKHLFKEIDELNQQEDLEYGDENLEEYGQNAELTSDDLERKAEQINTKIRQLQSNDQLTHNQVRKRISQVNQMKKHVAKLAKYEGQERILKGRKSYSKTDPDATFMRLKDDQLMPAYNIIHGTENQFIVNYTIHQAAGETNEFVKHIKQLKRFSSKMPKNAIGDATYGSEENYDYLTKHNIGNYLKYTGIYFEQTPKYKNNRFHKDNLKYNPQKDQFTCPNNKSVDFQYQTIKTSKSGYKNTIRVYECQSCQDCFLADRCKRGMGNKRIKFSPGFEAYKKQARDNFLTPIGIELKKKRGVDVETPFGDIKHNMNFHRFRYRGIENVNIEWGLVSIAHNLRKVARMAS